MSEQLRILIVEDSDDDAQLIRRHIQKAGYAAEIERVETAGELKAALDRWQWDIIIADYTVPGLGGLIALKIYKEKEIDTPFIVVSGTIGEELAAGCVKAGAQDYVMKDNLQRLPLVIGHELRDAKVRRERRRVENLLGETVEQLRRSNRELMDTNDKLKEFEGVKSDLVFLVSRELKPPVADIASSMSDLLAQDAALSAQERHNLLKRVESDAKYLGVILNQAFDITRGEGEIVPLERAPIELAPLIRETVESVAHLHGAVIELQLPSGGILPANVDPIRIKQVLANLINNAINRAGKRGGIIVTGQESENRIHVSVSDNGPGIASEEIPRLFTKSYPRERQPEGYGLGLAISKKIIEAHKGIIGVESQPGKRTSFYFELPSG